MATIEIVEIVGENASGLIYDHSDNARSVDEMGALIEAAEDRGDYVVIAEDGDSEWMDYAGSYTACEEHIAWHDGDMVKRRVCLLIGYSL